MINNTCINSSIKNLLALEIGSAFQMKGSHLIVNSSIFKGNSASLGGLFYIQSSIITSIFENCWFLDNYSFLGGVIYFSSFIEFLNSSISNCYFENNYATSIFNYKCFLLIYLC